MSRKISKILVANRGEIAVRVMRTARELGIRTVAVYSDADKQALHVEVADEAVHIGAASAGESYLKVEKIIDAAKSSKVDAIHPGYGFLSENAAFADAVQKAGLIFIGPSPSAMKLLGDKIASRKLAEENNVPITPGAVLNEKDSKKFEDIAKKTGYPVLIKAAAGGGGKGMRIVREPKELQSSIEAAQREAKSAFGDASVYLEKYIEKPRHIEFQIFCDGHGNAVHLGERECSIQRRHQKIIEESPSVALTPELRKKMGDAAVKLVKAAGYQNAGTVEFLLDGDNFYFLEVNARLQVEHPVTEAVTGEDLVAWQIAVAEGKPLPKSQEQLHFRGHAIECRIYAEDPAHNFLPSSGKILALSEPHNPGVRVDSGIREGSDVSVYYDPILAKVISYADSRDYAIRKMKAALSDYVLLGVRTPTGLLQDILDHPQFKSGNLHTHFLDEYFSDWNEQNLSGDKLAAVLFAATQALSAKKSHHENGRDDITTPWMTIGQWQIAGQVL